MTDGEALDAVITVVQRDGQEATDGETLSAVWEILSKWLGMCDGCGADLPPSELVTCEDGGTVCAGCAIIINDK